MDKTIKTTLLLASLTVLFVLVGRAIGGTGGMMIALFLAIAMNFGAYWFSDRMALAMSGAREVSEEDAPELHRMVEDIARAARLPKPRVHLIESWQPNAFATGRDPQHAAVAVTTGILRVLDYDELRGVLAHELGHVKNRDILVSSIAATIAGAVTMLANMAQWALIFGGFGRRSDEEGGGIADLLGSLLMIILAPIAAMLIQLAVSRAREYGADATGAEIIHNPLVLARALEKIERAAQAAPPMEVNPATAHLFLVNPLRGQTMARLFSTHPPIAERVRRLEEMAQRRMGLR
ncbi:MAG: zinc metalloprotease HtpX [Chloroflexi bacterium]|nr:zinc metalloprotease HtpX [Chloroflexota bacterium]